MPTYILKNPVFVVFGALKKKRKYISQFTVLECWKIFSDLPYAPSSLLYRYAFVFFSFSHFSGALKGKRVVNNGKTNK